MIQVIVVTCTNKKKRIRIGIQLSIHFLYKIMSKIGPIKFGAFRLSTNQFQIDSNVWVCDYAVISSFCCCFRFFRFANRPFSLRCNCFSWTSVSTRIAARALCISSWTAFHFSSSFFNTLAVHSGVIGTSRFVDTQLCRYLTAEQTLPTLK